VLVGLDVGDDDRGIVLHARFWHPVWAHPLHKWWWWPIEPW
jgi:hypothetical protein